MHEIQRAVMKMPHRHNYNVSIFYTRFPIFMTRNEKWREEKKNKNVLNKFEADIKLPVSLSLSFSGVFVARFIPMPICFYWRIPFVCPFSSFWSFKRAVVSLHFILALIHISFDVRRFAASLFWYIFFSPFRFYSFYFFIAFGFLI